MERTEIKNQFNLLKKGTSDIIIEEQLLEKLKKARQQKRPLRVKLGIDASASDIHLGSAVVLNKMRQFQDLGHQALFLIGDFTGMIGDPTGRSKTRRSLAKNEIKKNAKSLKRQIFKILDPKKTKIVFNSSWCSKMKFEDVIEIASHYTVAQLLERDDFEKRYNQGYPIGIHEFLYPLIQGYDSVVLKSDIEICGTDQRFNSIVARTFQQAYDQEPEVIMMMPILEGIGTKEKMSKSLGNYVGIEDKPEDMFGKIMRITDEQINDYFTLCTQLDKQQIEEIDKKVENPKEKKERLAYEIVKFYHNEKAAQKAKEIFEIKHGKSLRDKEDKLQVKEQLLKIAQEKVVNKQHSKNNKIWICKLLNVINAVSSNSEARRLIQQKGIKIDSKIIEDTNLELAVKEKGYLLQVGRRKVYKILFK